MKRLIHLLVPVCLAGSLFAGDSQTDIDRDVWDVIRRTVVESDIEGMAATYHPDAVFVFPGGTRLIREQLAEWGRDMVEMKAAGTTAKVAFRFTERQVDEHTAFEVGMFKYTATTKSGESTSYHVPFEALLVKKDGRWLMMMERQHAQVGEDAWNASQPLRAGS
ncbi:MAG: SgcJ/EcaC family oxidoreductase [Acidobacteria bacterium]|nr:SgcJ/EcaC family oxidoreductase [Acidobacteriota bacterium]NIM61540.1 SgcJ/EcaC family oxidoreductase [Acidobacteriota bacterium]NIO60551.1 SgcJ/EcaC family oxidoreductase [Acidobacteriota bacterium]NIQ31658.1 SgcJ/EcaC family oxidoreductase [Acidobacteriota bacterium]NIQ86897.1 SgcJ/EcaC family oxidoreductase [Acidobacteriota bacterium]